MGSRAWPAAPPAPCATSGSRWDRRSWGAIALGRAATKYQRARGASPKLHRALQTFYAAPAHAPAAHKETVAAAVAAVKSGPLGQNGVPATVPGPGGKPMPFNPLHSVAFHALDHAYNVGYFVCGAAAAVSFVLAAVALGGRRGASEPVSEGVTERHEPESALR